MNKLIIFLFLFCSALLRGQDPTAQQLNQVLKELASASNEEQECKLGFEITQYEIVENHLDRLGIQFSLENPSQTCQCQVDLRNPIFDKPFLGYANNVFIKGKVTGEILNEASHELLTSMPFKKWDKLMAHQKTLIPNLKIEPYILKLTGDQIVEAYGIKAAIENKEIYFNVYPQEHGYMIEFYCIDSPLDLVINLAKVEHSIRETFLWLNLRDPAVMARILSFMDFMRSYDLMNTVLKFNPVTSKY